MFSLSSTDKVLYHKGHRILKVYNADVVVWSEYQTTPTTLRVDAPNQNSVTVRLGSKRPGNVYIDWGDNSAEEKAVAENTHAYSQGASYTISIRCVFGQQMELKKVSGNATLTDISFGYGVSSIGNYAFSASRIASLYIPKSVVTIGKGITRACGSLSTITVDSNNPNYSSEGNCIIDTNEHSIIAGCKASTLFPNNVTSIGQSAFANIAFPSNTTITIPSSITSVQESAFENSSFDYLVIDNGVTKISGTKAFSYNIRLKSVDLSGLDLGTQYAVIPENTFRNCTSLTTVKLGNIRYDIGMNAFANCAALTGVYLENLEAWLSSTQYNNNSVLLSYAGKLYENNVEVTSVTTALNTTMLRGCTSLTSIKITGTANTYTVPANAYAGCVNLVSADFDESCMSIGSSAFNNCTSLMSITLRYNKVVTKQNNSLNNVPSNCIVSVPSGAVNSYKSSSDWSSRSAYIQAIA